MLAEVLAWIGVACGLAAIVVAWYEDNPDEYKKASRGDSDVSR